MRKLSKLVTILLLVATIVGCVPPGETIALDQDNSVVFDFVLVESPITGRCYELALRTAGASGYMGMAEIPCESVVEEGD